MPLFLLVEHSLVLRKCELLYERKKGKVRSGTISKVIMTTEALLSAYCMLWRCSTDVAYSSSLILTPIINSFFRRRLSGLPKITQLVSDIIGMYLYCLIFLFLLVAKLPGRALTSGSIYPFIPHSLLKFMLIRI
jgi:hypothetical protein